MKEEITKLEIVAVQIYCAKVTGFYANPESTSPAMEPAFEPCIDDAEQLLGLVAQRALPKRALQPVFNERKAG